MGRPATPSILRFNSAAIKRIAPTGTGGNGGKRGGNGDSLNQAIFGRGKTVALVGVDDLIVIDTPDALLVARRDLAQQVGDVVKALERRKREDLL